MRKFFIILLGFALLGCGGSSTILSSSEPTDAFKIGDTQWGLTLLGSWQRIPSPEGYNTVFLAQSASQNFVILQESGVTENLAVDILTKAKDGFVEFEELGLDKEENTLRFRGKSTLDTPLREFMQKVFVIPNTNAFLLGSCSWEPSISSSVDCQNILSSWQISVNKETPEK